jgi:dihydrofolate reductase
MNVNLILAISKNNVIAKDDDIPWRLSTDLKRFKNLTLNNTVIMGRKTFNSLKNKPLSNRENIVLSKSKLNFSGIIPVDSIKKSFTKSSNNDVFIIGGAEIYKQYLPFASKIYLTLVDLEITGDNLTYLNLDLKDFNLIESEPHIENNIKFNFNLYERKQ